MASDRASPRNASTNRNMRELRTVSTVGSLTVSTVGSLVHSWRSWVTGNEKKQASEPSGWAPSWIGEPQKKEHPGKPWVPKTTASNALMNQNQTTTPSTNQNQPMTASTNQNQPMTASTNQNQPMTASTNQNQTTTPSTNQNQSMTASTNQNQTTTASSTNQSQPTTAASTNRNQPTTASDGEGDRQTPPRGAAGGVSEPSAVAERSCFKTKLVVKTVATGVAMETSTGVGLLVGETSEAHGTTLPPEHETGRRRVSPTHPRECSDMVSELTEVKGERRRSGSVGGGGGGGGAPEDQREDTSGGEDGGDRGGGGGSVGAGGGGGDEGGDQTGEDTCGVEDGGSTEKVEVERGRRSGSAGGGGGGGGGGLGDQTREDPWGGEDGGSPKEVEVERERRSGSAWGGGGGGGGGLGDQTGADPCGGVDGGSTEKVEEQGVRTQRGQRDHHSGPREEEVKLGDAPEGVPVSWVKIKRPSVPTRVTRDAERINALSRGHSAVGHLKSRWHSWASDHTASQKLNPFSEAFDRQYSMSLRLQRGEEGYGRPKEGTKTAERARRAERHIHGEIDDLCYVIRAMAEPAGGGGRRVTFGALFDRYVRISDKVVGILLRARKHGRVAFDGEMLWQGRDDAAVITLLV